MSSSSLLSSVIADYTTTNDNSNNANNTETSSETVAVTYGPLNIVEPVVTGSVYTSQGYDIPVGTVFVEGLLTQSSMKKIICPVLPTPNEDTKLLLEDWMPNTLKFQIAGDGTLVRLFFHENRWLKATNFSLNLDNVNPALSQTQSFEAMFFQAAESVGLNYDLLDKDRVYFFLLQHPENIIIIQHNQASLVFVGSVKVSQEPPFYDVSSFNLECCGYSQNDKVMSFEEVMSNPVLRKSVISNLQIPEIPVVDEIQILNQLKPFDRYADQNLLKPLDRCTDQNLLKPLDRCTDQNLLKPLDRCTDQNLNAPVTFVGLIVTKFDADGFSRFRLDSPEYKAAKELRGRGSANDRRFKLLSILCGSSISDAEKETKLKQFIHVLPNYLPLVKQLNYELDELYHVVFTFYIMFFKDKNPDLVAPAFVKFLHKIQKELYLPIIKTHKYKMRMTKEHIATFILEQDPKQVMHLLMRLREMKERTPVEEIETIMNYTKK